MPFTSAVNRDDLVVHYSACNQWGCPYCGFRSAARHVSSRGTACVTCGDCNKGYMIVADELDKATIGVGSGKPGSDVYYPTVQEHPRKGKPKHGRPDEKPEEGGEYFSSRGVGTDRTSCFVCQSNREDMQSNIAAFVQCKAAGERIVTMFGSGARLDFREFEPDYLQVKVGACNQHVKRLRRLHSLTSDGRITEERIEQARAYTAKDS